jgi:hypothetical protein
MDPAPAPSASNPLALAPSGSAPGRANWVDTLRAAVAGFSVYGVAMAGVGLLQLAGEHPAALGHYGAEIAAVCVAVGSLVAAIMADRQPEGPPDPTPG